MEEETHGGSWREKVTCPLNCVFISLGSDGANLDERRNIHSERTQGPEAPLMYLAGKQTCFVCFVQQISFYRSGLSQTDVISLYDNGGCDF